jgi:Macrocin-O-methyltransferase (TylF)
MADTTMGKHQFNDQTLALYIDVIKRCLTDSIYIDDPLSRYVFYEQRPSVQKWRRAILNSTERFLCNWNIRLVRPYSDLPPDNISAARERGLDWPTRAHTMIGMKRLDNLQNCVESVIRDGIPGDLIETGVCVVVPVSLCGQFSKRMGTSLALFGSRTHLLGCPRPMLRTIPRTKGIHFTPTGTYWRYHAIASQLTFRNMGCWMIE